MRSARCVVTYFFMKGLTSALVAVVSLLAGCPVHSSQKRVALFCTRQIHTDTQRTPIYVFRDDLCPSPSAKTPYRPHANGVVMPAYASDPVSTATALPTTATPVWTAFFSLGSALLSQDAKARLRGRLPEIRHESIEVHGFTDALGGRSINKWLATERAKAVVAYLLAHGLPVGSIALHAHPRCCATERGLSRAEVASPDDRKAEIRINNHQPEGKTK